MTVVEIADHLATLRETPDLLMRVVRDRDAAALRARPFAGKWTPNEILGHLVDHEIVSACRVRTLRFEEVGWLGSYDQERWVDVQGHNAHDPAEHVRRFAELRALNVEQYAALSDDDLAAVRRRAGGDDVTLAYLVGRHAGHDLLHLDQVGRYVRAVVEGGTGNALKPGS